MKTLQGYDRELHGGKKLRFLCARNQKNNILLVAASCVVPLSLVGSVTNAQALK